jgi:hypothetical protein
MRRRCVTVYALNDQDQLNEAMSVLLEFKKLLPEGCDMQVKIKTDPSMADDLLDYMYGDLTQIVEFPQGDSLPEFQDSEIFKEQQKATRGYFTNVTTTSYNIRNEDS